MKVAFVDLLAQYNTIQPQIDEAIRKVISETAFISGRYASTFEKEFATYVGSTDCIACANGTDSLEILLQAMGIGAGDEVIIPALSWISTAEAITTVGATPVFIDVDEHLLMNLELLEAAITDKTKAIIPVHIYGNPVDMNRLMSIAEKHSLKVMEDCAQAHGARIGDRNTGTFGHCSSYSFYPGKNLGAYGDAGAMVTSDSAISRTARAIANHGQEGKHNHIMEGRNSRMDGLQAAILSAKLPKLEQWTEARIRIAKKYNELFRHPAVLKPIIREGTRHVFHLYVIQVERRAELMEFLKGKGIETAVHYPVPMPLMKCYSRFGHVASDFPVASGAADRILSLPIYPELPDDHISYVVEQVEAFYS